MAAFLFLAPASLVGFAPACLVGLPCAALLIIAPGNASKNAWSQPIAGMIGAISAALLVLNGGDGGRFGAATSAYIVLASGAFVSLVLLRPDTTLRQALRSIAMAGLATTILMQVLWGSDAWGSLTLNATRNASLAMRVAVDVSPDAFPVYEPMVRFMSMMWPGILALQTLAGLALAWQLYRRLAVPGPGESTVAAAPPMRFKDFVIGDGWVWGVIASLGVLILPVSSTLHVAGSNLGLVVATLYVLRGAAIVATFAEAFGISALALAIVATTAAALAVPLLFVLPGLCTLGITDTWYQYRRRLREAREQQGKRTNTP